jgi:UDP-2,4-diacetamido-2,4,6-trideoxy-beta-L-altropyranose hydrolase
MSERAVLFRCDASSAIGAGHVSRCLALADAFSYAGCDVRFLVGPETPWTCPELGDLGARVHVLAPGEDEVAAVRTYGAGRLLVVDHYGRDVRFERACRSFVHRIAAFDDASDRDHDCDVLLDAAAHSHAAYRSHVPEHAQVLCGLEYAAQRVSFREARPAALLRRDGKPAQRVLVSCGATDPGNLTLAVLTVLAEYAPALAVDVALSSQAPHLESVRRALPACATLHVDVRNMAKLMTVADISVGTPGATSYERAVLGLPSILIMVAENQRGVYNALLGANAAIGAGTPDEAMPSRLATCIRSLLADSDSRVRLSAISSDLVDGRGPWRIMLALTASGATTERRSVRLRLAEPRDEGWLLDLQRLPSTRRFFRNPQVPSEHQHRAWLTRTLSDSRKLLFVIEVGGMAAGSLRLDELATDGPPGTFEVSIAVDAGFARRGVATEALRFAQRLLPGARLHAEVAFENVGSQRLFLCAGFAQTSAATFDYVPHDMLSEASADHRESFRDS